MDGENSFDPWNCKILSEALYTQDIFRPKRGVHLVQARPTDNFLAYFIKPGVGAQGMCSEGDVIEGGFSVIFHGTFLDCKKVEVNHLT